MDINTRMEDFSYAYIRALAAQSGFTYKQEPKGMDNIGIDASVTDPLRFDSFPPVRFSAQIKCVRKSKLNHRKRGIFYSLKKKYYDPLTKSRPFNTILLIILVVPDNSNDWIIRDIDSVIVKHDCYWFCLGGKPFSSYTNEDSKEQIELVQTALLTPTSFPELMQKIADEDI